MAEGEDDYTEEIDCDISHSEESSLFQQESPHPSTSSTPDEVFQENSNIRKRKWNKTEGSAASETDEAILAYLNEKQKRNQNKETTLDEDQHFLMSLVSFMRNMPAEEKLQCHVKIMNALLEHTKT